MLRAKRANPKGRARRTGQAGIPARGDTAAGDHRRGLVVRVGTRVLRRPVVWGGLAAVVVIVLAAPALGFQSGLPDDRILPAEVSSTRQAYDQIRAGFAEEPQDSINAVATGIGDPISRRGAIAGYARDLSEVPGVAQVNSWAGTFADGQQIRPPDGGADRFVSASGTWLAAIPTQAVLAGNDVDELVAQIRAAPATTPARCCSGSSAARP